ncbi:hypothetical protein HK097_007065 [Rhizophlyctis rosea]|uniref:Mediator of RNA polymerase II transcription subunit 11 n=1 Tax=Rhizophlyctis rosea TaxID=64517 RepID=A0AAD5X1V8_9FUNG|nr:hypothetical protein HK097_007065 [Rhizophlyctis rosea]
MSTNGMLNGDVYSEVENTDDHVSIDDSESVEEGSEPEAGRPGLSIPNEQLIANLNQVEKLVIASLEAASKAIGGIATYREGEEEAGDPQNAAESAQKLFAGRSGRFFGLMKEIQKQVGSVIQNMTESGMIAGRATPYNATVAGEEKDFEIASKSVSLVLAKVNSALRDLEILTGPTALKSDVNA